MIKRVVLRVVATFKSSTVLDRMLPKQKRVSAKIIHCIGDSHVSVFSGYGTKSKPYMCPIWPGKSKNKNTIFKTYRVGPYTAYQLINKERQINKIINMRSSNVLKGRDVILFCFGEIDIRAHLTVQMKKQNLSSTEVIVKCINRYMQALKVYKQLGFDIAIWGPIASSPLQSGCNEFPIIGSCIDRNNITMTFNEELKKMCIKNNYKYVSIFKQMLLESGETNEKFLMDGFHLSQTAMPLIIKELKKKKLINGE